MNYMRWCKKITYIFHSDKQCAFEDLKDSSFTRWNSTDGPKGFTLQSYRTAIADLVNAFLKNLNEGKLVSNNKMFNFISA